jgi:hypothetical protein
MIGKDLKNILIYALLVIPIDSMDPWLQLKFNKIPATEITVVEKNLNVAVSSSASPLVYKLKEPAKVSGFSFKLKITGEMNAEASEKFEEDSYFRLGLVATGDKTLGAFQRLIAADWVKKLFDLSPKGVGLDKIYFYNVAQSKKFLGQTRVHPKSELMLETVIKAKDKDSAEVAYEEKFEKTKNIVAIWISIDGDQTNSKFQTQIRELSLQIE